MGIFSNFKKNIEFELSEFYINYFISTGVSKNEAQEMVAGMILSAKNDAEKEGTNNLPLNFGDSLLEKEKTDINIRKMLKQKRIEGVTDEDIRGWWNLHDLERRMALKYDELTQFTMFTYYIGNPPRAKMSKEEINKYATDIVKKYNAQYGESESGDESDDRKLPCELKDRVNIYIQKRMNDANKYKKDIEMSSSFNSLVRKEIERGKL